MRIFNKIYAWLFGYFWLPCPVCKKMFGGHEIANVMTAGVLAEDGRAYAVCRNRDCNKKATIKFWG